MSRVELMTLEVTHLGGISTKIGDLSDTGIFILVCIRIVMEGNGGQAKLYGYDHQKLNYLFSHRSLDNVCLREDVIKVH